MKMILFFHVMSGAIREISHQSTGQRCQSTKSCQAVAIPLAPVLTVASESASAKRIQTWLEGVLSTF